MPSRWPQISVSTRSSSGVGAKSGRCDRARSTKSCSDAASDGNGPIRQSSSPARASGWRLVARIAMPGHAVWISLASRAEASGTCSQLSRISNAVRDTRWSSTTARSSRSPPDTPSASATVAATTRPLVAFERSAIHTPSRHSAATPSPSSTASRVFPMPPGPTIVSSRPGASRRLTSAIASSRPTNVVAGAMRLWPSAGTARTGTGFGNGSSRGAAADRVTGWSKSRRRYVPTGSTATESSSAAAVTASSDASTKPPFAAPTTRDAWCKASAM